MMEQQTLRIHTYLPHVTSSIPLYHAPDGRKRLPIWLEVSLGANENASLCERKVFRMLLVDTMIG